MPVRSIAVFVKGRKFVDFADLNHWLTKQCLSMAATHKHPDLPHRTVSEVFKEEQGFICNSFPDPPAKK
jgi:hypothetical protein